MRIDFVHTGGSPMKITCFDDIVTEAKQKEEKTIIAVVQAHDRNTLEALVKAKKDGLSDAILFGNGKLIEDILSQLGASITDFQIIDCDSDEISLSKAIEAIHSGSANGLMKGIIDTSKFMKAVVNKENKLLSGKLLSVMGFYQVPSYHKMFAVTDFGMNTYPTLDEKKCIIENAVKVFHAIGNDNPKVAVMAAVEHVNPNMPECVDADALKKMNQDGQINGCIVEGPISFDLAMDKNAAKIKGYKSAVAGDADLIVVPDITSGNILVKALTILAGSPTAGLTLGARVPVIMTSRSAEAMDKYYTIALAACVAKCLQ